MVHRVSGPLVGRAREHPPAQRPGALDVAAPAINYAVGAG